MEDTRYDFGNTKINLQPDYGKYVKAMDNRPAEGKATDYFSKLKMTEDRDLFEEYVDKGLSGEEAYNRVMRENHPYDFANKGFDLKMSGDTEKVIPYTDGKSEKATEGKATDYFSKLKMTEDRDLFEEYVDKGLSGEEAYNRVMRENHPYDFGNKGFDLKMQPDYGKYVKATGENGTDGKATGENGTEGKAVGENDNKAGESDTYARSNDVLKSLERYLQRPDLVKSKSVQTPYLNEEARIASEKGAEFDKVAQAENQIANRDYRQDAEQDAMANAQVQNAQMAMQNKEGSANPFKTKLGVADYDTYRERQDKMREQGLQNRTYAKDEELHGTTAKSKAAAADRNYIEGQRDNTEARRLSTGYGYDDILKEEKDIKNKSDNEAYNDYQSYMENMR